MKTKTKIIRNDEGMSATISTNDSGKRHGVCKWFKWNGKLWYEETNENGKLHGLARTFNLFGRVKKIQYWLYNEEVSKEEYKKFRLIEQLSGLGE